MFKIEKLILSIFILLSLQNTLIAQCPSGQMNVTIEIETDNYGYEGYWQIVPAGNTCDIGTIWEGGNAAEVGCEGAGDQDATPAFGYGNNLTIEEEIGCLDEGFYDLIYIEDWGDGGFEFHISLDGYDMYHFEGSGLGNIFNFEITPPLEYDASVYEITVNPYINPGDIIISGNVFNYSSNTINSLEIFYSIDGGSEVLASITGLNIEPFESAHLEHPIEWNATTVGNYELKLSSGQINGNDDLNTSNDYYLKTIVVGDPKPNLIADYVSFVEEYEIIGDAGDLINNPTDLDFHPILSDYQVWITNKGTEGTGGSTVTFWNAGKPEQTSLWKQDGNAWHFMSLPTAIAFSNNTNFATAPGVKDANHGGGTFTGPTLWSSDMDIYGEPSGGNGSHLDMLHQSPYTMGICAEIDNGFYTFCDWHGHIHYYNFMEDHGAGNDDHSDGIVRKYTDFDVDMINKDLPCHLALDEEKIWLYIIDAGNGRIIKLNTQTGNIMDDWEPTNEPLAESTSVVGTEWHEIVTDGLLEPVGIDVMDNYMLVSDHATGDIIIYDITTVPAIELRRLQTGRNGLMGITIGPDGLIWFVDQDADEFVRINISNTVAIENINQTNDFILYPNPSNGVFSLVLNNMHTSEKNTIKILNVYGEEIYNKSSVGDKEFKIDISKKPAGSYIVLIESEKSVISKQFILIK